MTRHLHQPHVVSSRRRSLLQGVSLTALLLTSGEATAAAPFRSLNQALSAAKTAIAAAAGTTPQAGISAARTAQLGAQNLAAAATRFRSLADSLAAVSAQNAPVPNGLAPGGLQFLSGTGASAPAQAVGTYNVTVTQTQQLAQLSWQTFNIGAHTKLTFNQSAGGTLASSWVVINTISDPAENPSTILGAISAPGKVYVLNRNGIIFGAGSTINVGGLVAATADIAQSQFSTDANGQAQFTLYGAQNGSTYLPTFVNGGTAGITVDAGASIATPAATGIRSWRRRFAARRQCHQRRCHQHAAGADHFSGRHSVHLAPRQRGLDHRGQHHQHHARQRDRGAEHARAPPAA